MHDSKAESQIHAYRVVEPGQVRAMMRDSLSGCVLCFSTLLIFALLGCAYFVKMDDPRLTPFASMYQVDLDKFGLSPLPKEAKVHIEERHGIEARKYGYDVMLHIYSKATHHVAFRLEHDSYVWVGETETCKGPRTYNTPDGIFNEELDISYFHGVLHAPEGLRISYDGPDQTLKLQRDIPIPQARQLLIDWGCGQVSL